MDDCRGPGSPFPPAIHDYESRCVLCRNDGREGDDDVSADDVDDADVGDGDDGLVDEGSGLLPPEMNVATDCTWLLRWT